MRLSWFFVQAVQGLGCAVPHELTWLIFKGKAPLLEILTSLATAEDRYEISWAREECSEECNTYIICAYIYISLYIYMYTVAFPYDFPCSSPFHRWSVDY